jgi:hypothetical protein
MKVKARDLKPGDLVEWDSGMQSVVQEVMQVIVIAHANGRTTRLYEATREPDDEFHVVRKTA